MSLRLLIKSNLLLYLLYCITPKHVTSLQIPSPHHCAQGNTASFEQMSQWWRTVGNTVFNLIGRRFESQTSRSSDERVTAQPTGWSRLLFLGLIVPLRPWILFVAYRFFFSTYIVLNKSLLTCKNYQYFTGASVSDLQSQAQIVTF